MKKRTTKTAMTEQLLNKAMDRIHRASQNGRLTIGLDLGDRHSDICILDPDAEVLVRAKVPTEKAEIQRVFSQLPASLVAMEVGTHSPWVSRKVAAAGHETVVANPREIAWITKSQKKNDRVDAEKLARLARADQKLLSPVRHRGEEAQRDLTVVRARAELVRARTGLINSARGLAKSLGERLPSRDADYVGPELAEHLSNNTAEALRPMLAAIQKLTAAIAGYDAQIEGMKSRYPEVKLLTPVFGVGPIVATTFVLTVEDPGRFRKSREIGPYLGLAPAQRDSGDQSPQLGISKQGDRALRTLLVQSAQCMLRENAPDSDLRRWAMKQLERPPEPEATNTGSRPKKNKKGGGSHKKRVVVALARRLAVLLHRLWAHGEVYDPLYGAKTEVQAEERRNAKRKAVAA